MNKFLKVLLPAMLALSVTACDDDDDNDVVVVPELENTYLRVIHGSADAPLVNINANGAPIDALQGVDFTVGSGFLTLTEGNYEVTVDAVLADGSTAEVLDLGRLVLDPLTEYSVIAHGYVSADMSDTPLGTKVIANPVSEIDAGNIRLQVLHGAPNAPAVDLHVTGAMDDLGASLGTLSYGENTDQLQVPAGQYRVRLVVNGTDTVAYDIVLPALDAGADLLVTAVPNTGVGTSPVVLLASSGTETMTLIDDRTTAQVRVVHAVKDAPAVDVWVGDAKVDALSGAAYRGFVNDYVALPEGAYDISLAVTGADPVAVAFTDEVSVMTNMSYTIHAVGTLDAADDIALEYYATEDTRRVIATAAQVRVVHAWPEAGNVDVYVTADGDISEATAVLSDVAYKMASGYLAVPAGDYVITVTAAGNKDTVAIDTMMLLGDTIMLEAGKIYTATAVDPDTAGPAAGLPLILTDDFAG